LEYLFEKLSGEDFFKEVNKGTSFHHDLSRLTEKKLLVMDEIMNTLMDKLKTIGAGIKETNDEVT